MFSFLVLHIAQLGTIVRNLDISANEIIDVTAIQVGWKQRGLIFHHSGPSRKSGGGEGSSRKL